MKILIQCGDSIENQRRIFNLASELKIQGHTPVVLLYSEMTGNIFRVNGIETEYLNRIAKNCKSLDSLSENYIKKELLNIEALRRPEIFWPGQLQRTLRSVKKIWTALNVVISQHKPDRICIWNGYTGYVANCLRIISRDKEIKSAFLERGLLKDSLFIDKLGTNGASSVSQQLYEMTESDNANRLANTIFQLSENFNEKKHESKTEVIFVPMQVQHDTNIILYSRYKSMREFFLETYNNLNKSNRIFIVRPHPEEEERYPLNIPRFDNVIVDSKDSLDNQIQKSNVVVTINSTVGLQALIKGKPVISTGKGIFSKLNSLATYSNINRSPDFKEIESYLAGMLKYNLVFKDNPFNDKVISHQLELHSDNCMNNSGCYKINKRPFPHGEVKVFLDIDFNTRLNLTYRKHSERISVEYIDEMLKKYNITHYNFVRNENESNLVITDKVMSVNLKNKNNKIIDIYGVEIN